MLAFVVLLDGPSVAAQTGTARRSRVLFVRPADPGRQQPGALMALEPDGGVRVIAQPLADPRAVVELPDGTAFVTDRALGLVVGIGGRFGEGRMVEFRTGLRDPHALTLGDNGELYVTTAGDGGLWDVAIDGPEAVPVATGLGMPESVATASDGTVIVGDAHGGRVLAVDPRTGAVETVGTGFEDLVGVAPAPSGGAFACDRAGGVFRVEAGAPPELLASVDRGQGLTLLAPDPETGVGYLAVPTPEGLTAIHPETGATAVIPGLDQLGPAFSSPAQGPLFEPPPALVAPPITTTSTTSITSTPTTTTAPASAPSSEGSGTSTLPVVLAGLAVLGAAGGAGVVYRRRRAGGPGKKPAGGGGAPGAAKDPCAEAEAAAARLAGLEAASAAWDRYVALGRKLAELKERHAELMKGNDFAAQIAIEREIAQIEAEIAKAAAEMKAVTGRIGSVKQGDIDAARAEAARAQEECDKARAAAQASPPAEAGAAPATGTTAGGAKPEPPTPPGAFTPPCVNGEERRVTVSTSSFVIPTSQPKVTISSWMGKERLSADSFAGILDAAGVASELLGTVDEVLGWASYVGVAAPAAIGKAAASLQTLARGLSAVTRAGGGIASRRGDLFDVVVAIEMREIVCTCTKVSVCRDSAWVDLGIQLSKTEKAHPGYSRSNVGATLAELAAVLSAAADAMDAAVAAFNGAESYGCPGG